MREMEGDSAFRSFFAEALALSKRIKAEAPLFDARLLTEGVVLVERYGGGARYSAILNLDGRSGALSLPRGLRLEGETLMGKAPKTGDGSIVLARDALVLAVRH
jgi:hypothetical protein